MKNKFVPIVIFVTFLLVLGVGIYSFTGYENVEGEKGSFLRFSVNKLQGLTIYTRDEYAPGERFSAPFLLRYSDVDTSEGTREGYDSAKVVFRRNTGALVDSWDIVNIIDQYEACDGNTCSINSYIAVTAPTEEGTYYLSIVITENLRNIYSEEKIIRIVEPEEEPEPEPEETEPECRRDSDCEDQAGFISYCEQESCIYDLEPEEEPEPEQTLECTLPSQCDDKEGFEKACVENECVYSRVEDSQNYVRNVIIISGIALFVIILLIYFAVRRK
ncbi:MAG: hypothetical protein ACE5RP_00185 [Nitrosopumilus sp.]